jgi:membrane associated rhomboid family serine protease
MLIPIGDDNRDRHITPYVTYLLVIINILVFVFLQGMGNNELFSYTYSTVPAEILTGLDVVGTKAFSNPIDGEPVYIRYGQSPLPVYFTLLSSMFMHGGFAHLFGNMMYLWIFGDNLENDMGHFKYLMFYLLCGVLASLAHVYSTAYFGQNPFIPSLGASGAISGVLGGYLLQHPTRRVHVWVFITILSVPALIAVGLWFVFQLISGMGALGRGTETGGVAYAAHIGGFIAGFILVKFCEPH